MKTITAEPLFQVQNSLGEGPLWHPVENRLYWTDITEGDLYQSSRDLTTWSKTHFDTSIGSFGFCADGSLILATGRGFSFWKQGQTTPKIIWNPLPNRDDVRMNDGKVDPAGRFWAGSMDPVHSKGELYRLDPDGNQHTLLHNIGISNGLGWSPDHNRMYYTDSQKYSIDVFDYDLATGQISNQRPFVRLDKDSSEIVPDGLCVDVEGCVWSAHWNGWQIVRYDPQGKPILRVKLPVQRVTSCCFGGEQRNQLFITTARIGLSAKELADQPHAGDLFTCSTSTQGQVTNLFG